MKLSPDFQPIEIMVATDNSARSLRDAVIEKTSYGKPFIFKGEAGQSFNDWAHKVAVYMFGIGSHASAHLLLRWCTKQTVPIEVKNVPLDFRDDAEKVSQNLYVLCSGHTENEAHRIVRSNNDFNGLEVWRQLHLRFCSKNAGRNRQELSKLVTPTQCKSIVGVRNAIVQWESDLRLYEDAAG